MRIELDTNDILIIQQPLKTNGHGKIRYSMMTERSIRHFYNFNELVKALKDYFGIEEEK